MNQKILKLNKKVESEIKNIIIEKPLINIKMLMKKEG